MIHATPRIYVACLAAYNAGKLHGVWIDCDQTEDQIWEEINTMLKNSPEPDAEEHAIHAFEGFGNYELSESEPISEIVELAELIEEHGDQLVSAVMNHCTTVSHAKLMFDEGFSTYKNFEDWGYQMLEGMGENLPDHLQFYFDYEAYAHGFEADYNVFEADGQIHVFQIL